MYLFVCFPALISHSLMILYRQAEMSLVQSRSENRVDLPISGSSSSNMMRICCDGDHSRHTASSRLKSAAYERLVEHVLTLIALTHFALLMGVPCAPRIDNTGQRSPIPSPSRCPRFFQSEDTFPISSPPGNERPAVRRS
jgi:hypothetical protein